MPNGAIDALTVAMRPRSELDDAMEVLCATLSEQCVSMAIERLYASAEARNNPLSWEVVNAFVERERAKRVAEVAATLVRQQYLKALYDESLPS